MSLHIFLDDEELLYFVVRVEVVEIQIWFEFKLVCNLQKGWAEFLVLAQPASSRAQSMNSPVCGRPVKRESDPISLEPDLNPLSYPLSRSFKLILFPF
jgi:hypothetical protein